MFALPVGHSTSVRYRNILLPSKTEKGLLVRSNDTAATKAFLVELAARSGKYEYGVVIRESAIQYGLEHVVDDPLIMFNDRPNVDALN
jgi:hypothetical protein